MPTYANKKGHFNKNNCFIKDMQKSRVDKSCRCLNRDKTYAGPIAKSQMDISWFLLV